MEPEIINRGSDLRYDLEITLEEAATGRTAEIEFPRLIKCKQCNGDGSLSANPQSARSLCQACNGVRQIKQDTKIKVRIPFGVDTGSRLRIAGMGDEGIKEGAATGDLYVVVHIAEHEIFEREGTSLYTTISVTSEQFTTGGKVNVPTLTDGQTRLRIPAGTKVGQVFRFSGRGMPTLGSDKRGDLFVSLTQADPSADLRRQQESAFRIKSHLTPSDQSAIRRMTMKPYNDSPRLLRIFLCHSSSDKQAVRELCHRLSSAGLEPWLDEEKLLPGQRWRDEIPRAVKDSDLVIVCLSRESINKSGYVQREIKYALDAALEQPENTIFLIPLRLEECEVPQSLSDWQWVDYFDERGYERLKLALDYRAEALGVDVRASAGRTDSGKSRDLSEATVKEGQSEDSFKDAFPVKVSTAVDARGDKILPHAIGIETLGGVFAKIIPEGTILPYQLSEIFSTATDNQTSVEIHVLAGSRPLAQQNLSLGKFHLVGIPLAPRGMPQIEVTFEIDENGGVNVTARDLATGRIQRITITSPSGPSKEEIERIVQDAKKHSEEDTSKREEIETRNRLDGSLYVAEKTFTEHKEQFDTATRSYIELAITEAKRSLQEGGVSRMEIAVSMLKVASHRMAEIIYRRGDA